MHLYVNGDFHNSMLNIILKIWTFLEILSFLEKKRPAKEKKEQEECDSPTQDPQKNTTDTP
jgi:hypothetical protein